MIDKLSLGVVNKLTIEDRSEYGFYLCDREKKRVLLPNLYVKDRMSVGDEIEVFIYKDSEDRVVATTLKPYATLGEFAYLKVTDVTSFGAFLDWGLPKELLVPKKMQKNPLKISRKYIVYITYDPQSDRLVADTRIGRYLKNDPSSMKNLNRVDILIIAKTPLGYKVIANNKFEGMIYHSEIYENVKIGEKRTAYIKKIRDDSKLDLSLNPPKKMADEISKQKILNLLREKNSVLPFTYKSDPKEIRDCLGISKKSYKRALTALLQERQIELGDDFIRLKKRISDK